MPKGNYKRTSKKDYKKQLARIERRKARINHIRQKLTAASVSQSQLGATPRTSSANDLTQHYHIGVSENHPCHIGSFLRSYTGDPAIKVSGCHWLSHVSSHSLQQDFLPNLKMHLLSRLREALQRDSTGANPESSRSSPSHLEQISSIYFKNDVMYQHNVLRINYTTYDVRRAQDIINPKTDHRDVLFFSTSIDQTTHEYQYARVIGIYHVNLIYCDPSTYQYRFRRMEFLWVRYFKVLNNVSVKSGWSTASLDQVQPCRVNDTDAFGFLDPDQVLRACHLIQRFSLGRQYPDGNGLSGLAGDGHDWRRYYVNRWV